MPARWRAVANATAYLRAARACREKKILRDVGVGEDDATFVDKNATTGRAVGPPCSFYAAVQIYRRAFDCRLYCGETLRKGTSCKGEEGEGEKQERRCARKYTLHTIKVECVYF